MRIKKRYLFPLILIGAYLLGPRPHFKAFDAKLITFTMPLNNLDQWIADREAKVANLKPNNQSRIIWADSIRKTPYSVVYLHGFSASPMEGHPVHQNFAERYGCNLYIPRLPQHGIEDPETFANLEPVELIEAAKEAIAVGQLLGDKVILMSCSTGSTLALYLAAENPDLAEALIMYSPNIDLADRTSELITLPWGSQLTNAIAGEYRVLESLMGTPRAQYTTTKYRSRGLVSLKYLIEETMTEKYLSKIQQPFMIAYYYKNEEAKDQIVSIESMKWLHRIAATPSDQKALIPIPNAGNHVLPSNLYSKDIETVQNETYAYVEKVLKMVPKYTGN